MVNENIQGVIPLAGKGHTRKTHGDYGPGEFFSLVNAEIGLEGTIIPRRPVQMCGSDFHFTGDTNYHNLNTIVGHYKDGVVVSGSGKQGFIRGDGPLVISPWDADNVKTDITAEEDPSYACNWAKLVGFVRYNRYNYWMYLCNMKVGTSAYWFEYWLYYAKETNPLTDDITDITTLPTTKVRVYTTNPALTESSPMVIKSGDEPTDPGATVKVPPSAGRIVRKIESPPLFRKMFIHKERLWLVTNKNVVFSKATDPQNWKVPEGGFFNFQEDEINDAVALKDSIYVILDNSISAINYNLDPNALSDVTVKQIGQSLGGDSAVVVSDVVYFARDNGLYSIVNQSITKVLDLNVRTHWEDAKRWKLVAFGNYIIALYTNLVTNNLWGTGFVDENVPNPPDWETSLALYEGHWVPPVPFYTADTILDGDAYFINTDNGAVHGFYFGHDIGGVAPQYLADMYFCPIEDSGNRQKLYIMTKYQYSGSVMASVFSTMIFSKEDPTVDASDVWLSPRTASYEIIAEKIPFIIELQRFRPEGSGFLMKKFRNLLLEGNVPNNTKLKFNFSHSVDTWLAPYTLLSSDIDVSAQEDILPGSVRVPINQRARGLTFKMYPDPATLTATPFGALNLNRLTVLWSYTGRGPVSSTSNVGPDSQSA